MPIIGNCKTKLLVNESTSRLECEFKVHARFTEMICKHVVEVLRVAGIFAMLAAFCVQDRARIFYVVFKLNMGVEL